MISIIFQVKCVLRFRSVTVEKPKFFEENGSIQHDTLTPQICRLRDLTYESYVYVDIQEWIYHDGKASSAERYRHQKVCIGTIPMMVKSEFCALRGVRDKDLASVMMECPLDPGGYFIVNGSEKVRCSAFFLQFDSDRSTNAKFLFVLFSRWLSHKSVRRWIKWGFTHWKSQSFPIRPRFTLLLSIRSARRRNTSPSIWCWKTEP